MIRESLGFDPYEVVLADLRAKRDQLDQTIKLLEAQRGRRTRLNDMSDDELLKAVS
jgi:BMFP domain-containing protein YqiC